MSADRYTLQDRVVEGDGWASWRGTDAVLNRDVGVLVVSMDHPRRAAVAEAARTASCITDPGFLQVYDVTEDATGLQVVQEWTHGTKLVERLSYGPLPAEEACALGLQVARALAAAHGQGVEHGALGPGDVLVTEEGRARVRGLAVRAALDDEPGPQRSDSWACAALTFAAVTGRWPGADRDGLAAAGRPDAVPRPRQVRAGVPKALDRALTAALTDPPADPAQVGLALEGVLAAVGRRTTDEPARPREDGGHRSRSRALVVAVTVLALAGATWLGFVLAGERSVDDARPPTSSPTGSPSGSPSPSSPVDTTGRVPVVAGEDFDPAGNGSENPEDVPLAFDGSLATAWRTVSYDEADLAPKKGVGVVFDLGRVETVGAVRLDLLGAGTTVDVLVSETAQDRLRGFTPFGSVTNAGELVALRSPTPVQARYVLVWLTRLPPDGATYRGGVVEIVVARS
ncbi:MAG TPA: hypothetical protein VEV13_05910 [Candidatus Limnocylindria bacterium]|nr:hypothetical protein [Candidatus Limnocylindria bacterium]